MWSTAPGDSCPQSDTAGVTEAALTGSSQAQWVLFRHRINPWCLIIVSSVGSCGTRSLQGGVSTGHLQNIPRQRCGVENAAKHQGGHHTPTQESAGFFIPGPTILKSKGNSPEVKSFWRREGCGETSQHLLKGVQGSWRGNFIRNWKGFKPRVRV